MVEYINIKLNRLIEARDSSVSFSKARQPLLEKGTTAEVKKSPELFCWAVREYLPDCHIVFVKRYRWLFQLFLLRREQEVKTIMDRLT